MSKQNKGKKVARQQSVKEVRLMRHKDVQPSTYNPRERDPARIELIKLSLGKLGFLLPLFADKSGEISSGHQRHFASGPEHLNWPNVPVWLMDSDMPLDMRKSVNIMHNRATNDMAASDIPQEMTAQLSAVNIWEMAEQVADIDMNNPREMYPCMYPEMWNVKELCKINEGHWNRSAHNFTKQLIQKGVRLDLIVDPDGNLVNGIGRLEYAAKQGNEQIRCIVVPAKKAEFARMCLNLISMNFDIKGKYGDYVRRSSFRRARVSTPGNDMGYGFTMFALGDKQANSVNLTEHPDLRLQWEVFHGRSHLDFGAGRLKDTECLRQLGFDVTPFEPFFCPPGTDRISQEESVKLNRLFLEDVAAGKQWDSLFLSAVLNSVPFYEDRIKVLCILHACYTPGRTRGLFISANSIYSPGFAAVKQKDIALHPGGSRSAAFLLSYEDGVKIEGLQSGKPKVQKFHTKKEFVDMLSLYFDDVQAGYYFLNVTKGIGRKPKPIDPDALREALIFEFNLPTEADDIRLGLHNEAIAAFNKRLGLDMPLVE